MTCAGWSACVLKCYNTHTMHRGKQQKSMLADRASEAGRAHSKCSAATRQLAPDPSACILAPEPSYLFTCACQDMACDLKTHTQPLCKSPCQPDAPATARPGAMRQEEWHREFVAAPSKLSRHLQALSQSLSQTCDVLVLIASWMELLHRRTNECANHFASLLAAYAVNMSYRTASSLRMCELWSNTCWECGSAC